MNKLISRGFAMTTLSISSFLKQYHPHLSKYISCETELDSNKKNEKKNKEGGKEKADVA